MFLLRDAMLRGASYGPVFVCLSVRRFFTSRYSFETAGQIELVSLFGMEAFFHLSYLHYAMRKFGYTRKLRYFFLEVIPNSWTWKILPRQVDRIINKTRRRSSLLTTLTTVDAS